MATDHNSLVHEGRLRGIKRARDKVAPNELFFFSTQLASSLHTIIIAGDYCWQQKRRKHSSDKLASAVKGNNDAGPR